VLAAYTQLRLARQLVADQRFRGSGRKPSRDFHQCESDAGFCSCSACWAPPRQRQTLGALQADPRVESLTRRALPDDQKAHQESRRKPTMAATAA
jgi:hypothetical protein